MSRGPGKLQRGLFGILQNAALPMTFAEMRGGSIDPTFERSCRRALKRMIEEGVIVVASGEGGPGDPHRYCINPMLAGFITGTLQLPSRSKRGRRGE